MTKQVLQTDVCVVGCGPAGITVAHELVQSGNRVAIVESGRMTPDPFAQAQLKGTAVGPVIKGFRHYLSTSRVAGVFGSASRWGGYCTPLTPIDFESRDWVPQTGWPITAATLKPFEDRAANALGISAFESAVQPLPESCDDSIGRLVSHAYHYPPNLYALRDRLLALVDHPAFRLKLGLTAMDFAASSGQVQWMRALGVDGEELYVEAEVFILAAGGIENAHILLLNSGERKANLANNRSVIGQYFQEHFHVLAGRVRIPNARAWADYIRIAPNPSAGHMTLRTVVINDEVQRKEQLLNASIEISAKALSLHDVETAIDSGGPIECDIFVRSEQAPNPQSRVILGDSLDQLGRQRVDLRWQTCAQDWDSIVKSVDIVVSEMERKWNAQSKIMIDRAWPWPWAPLPPSPVPWHWHTWGNHHMGTTRMSSGDASGVVDSDCQVHGASNLFVAGSSIFPNSGFANPTFTIVALSIRLAEHLISMLNSRK
jgi:choline dehydrogenase-like flavoprotein